MKAILIGVLVGIVLGAAAMYWFLNPRPQPTQETFRPGHIQKDGSVDLTRIPTTPKDAGPPPHMIPKGAKETARTHLVVKPKPVPVEPGQTLCSCEDIMLELSLYRGKDGTGMVASADNAEVGVHESTYTPLLDTSPPQYRRFFLVTHEPGKDNFSALIGRRYLNNRFGVGIGVAKREAGDMPALVGMEFNW